MSDLLKHALKDFGSCIYQVIALSVEAKNSNSDERFDTKIAEATRIAKELDDLRRRHRYTIPFVFDPIWHLKGLPLYVSHYQNDRDNERLETLCKKATDLRKEIDKNMELYFFYGKKPGIIAKCRLSRKSSALQKEFKDGAP